MLKLILNDNRLNNKNTFSIVILPPQITNIDENTNDAAFHNYLASHVVQIPWNLSLEENISRIKSENNKLSNEITIIEKDKKRQQLLITVNDNIYKASNNQITYKKRKVDIIQSKLLYNELKCTHLILYTNKPIIDLIPTVELSKQKTHNLNDLRFKETISNTKSSDAIVSKIDDLVMNFVNDSVNCKTLSSLHDCMESILSEGYNQLDKIIPNASSEIYEMFESYIMDLTYDVLFFKMTQLLLPKDKKLSNALHSMEHLDHSQVGLPSTLLNERKRVQSAILEFEKIGSFRTPTDKLDCLLKTIHELTKNPNQNINDPENEKNSILDSDSLIPLLLMTLVKSKVPHLIANLMYIKEYTFERNIVTGKYGYALSTFEGVLDYIIVASLDLSKISEQNLEFWSAIKAGDLNLIDSASTVCDAEGNNPLMIACIHDQPRLVKLFLTEFNQRGISDAGATPLICAVKNKCSTETLNILLESDLTLKTIDTVDYFGNTALLYACCTNNLESFRTLVQVADLTKKNSVTQDNALQLAIENNCSIPFLKELLSYPSLDLTEKNRKGETAFHTCHDVSILDYLIQKPESIHHIMYSIDHDGKTPLTTWASKGRLDLIELLLPFINPISIETLPVDNKGQTLLHLLALATPLRFGKNSLDFIVETFQPMINTREWVFGNTPLHFLAETTTFNSNQSKSNTVLFMKTLIKYGALLDSFNFRDEYPIDICKTPELILCLDEMNLKTEFSLNSMSKHSLYQYTWAVTRAQVEQRKEGKKSEIFYIIKSGLVGQAESMKAVKRKLQDFVSLRNSLLREIPELFLSTLEEILSPETIDLFPPPLTVVHHTLKKLQAFMENILYHPILRYHEKVVSFVRSELEINHPSPEINPFYHDSLFKQEKYLEGVVHPINTQEEDYFLKYIEETMNPLKLDFLNIIKSGRELIQSRSDLESAMQIVTHLITNASIILEDSELFSPNSLPVKTIAVCANITSDRSFTSPWSYFSKNILNAFSITEGISLSLKRPYELINERDKIREDIEAQKEALQKSQGWQIVFSTKERKKRLENDKLKVIENMNKVNQIDIQLNHSHKMVSDELAHFQTIHPKQMIKAIRNFAKLSIESEKHKLSILNQTLSEWENESLKKS